MLQVTEYASQTVQEEGVLVTDTLGAANAESGIAKVANAMTAWVKARMNMDDNW